MESKRIYTVDDYPLAAYTVKRTIEKLSHHQCIVSDFESPIVLMKNFEKEFQNIDMIITDYEMLNLRGNELIKQVRSIKSNIKIIIISAWLDSNKASDKDSIKQEVKELAPDLILSKPFPTNWVEQLDKILENA